MQSVSSRIWTRVAVIISYDDNHYTTGTSNCDNGYAKRIQMYGHLRLNFDIKNNKASDFFDHILVIYIFVYSSSLNESKISDLSRGWPKGSLFNSYYT